MEVQDRRDDVDNVGLARKRSAHGIVDDLTCRKGSINRLRFDVASGPAQSIAQKGGERRSIEVKVDLLVGGPRLFASVL